MSAPICLQDAPRVKVEAHSALFRALKTETAQRPVQPREPRRDCEVLEPRAAKRRLEQVLGYGPGPLTTCLHGAARRAK
jgi:hypothetical protein